MRNPREPCPIPPHTRILNDPNFRIRHLLFKKGRAVFDYFCQTQQAVNSLASGPLEPVYSRVFTIIDALSSLTGIDLLHVLKTFLHTRPGSWSISPLQGYHAPQTAPILN